MEGIEKLDIANPEAVTNWHERYLLFESINDKIDMTVQAKRTAFYLTKIGKEAYDLLKSRTFPELPKDKKVEELQDILVGEIRPKHFALAERKKFHNLIRKDNESFRSFMLRLQTAAINCKFDTNLDDSLRDRIVAGINHSEVEKKLLEEASLTYARAREILETWDDVNSAVVRTSS